MENAYLRKLLVCGMLLLGLCLTVYAKPATSDTDVMQNDDYDDYEYSEDQSTPDQQSKPSHAVDPKNRTSPFFPTPNVSVTGELGKNITIQCEAKNLKDEVILWFKGNNMISSGSNLVSPMYSLDPNTFALTIINATAETAGDYICELLPQEIRMRTHVIVAEPTSTSNSQEANSFRSSFSLILATAFGIVLILRI